MNKIRVVVVDDQPMIRLGLSMMLGHEPDIVVVGEAGDGSAAVALIVDVEPDVVLMDIRMPGTDGLDAARRVQAESNSPPRIIMLTTFDDDEYVLTAMRDGASGFLLKDAEPHQIAAAVRRVYRGDAILDPSVTRVIIDHWRSGDDAPTAPPNRKHQEVLARLTDREREVLAAVARGGGNREIAEQLFLAEATVKSHVHALLSKLELSNRAQLVVFAYESGVAT